MSEPKGMRFVEDYGLGPVDESFGKTPESIAEAYEKDENKEDAKDGVEPADK